MARAVRPALKRHSSASRGHVLHGPGELSKIDARHVVEEVPAHGGEVRRPRPLQTGESGFGEDGVAAARVMGVLDAPDQPFALQPLRHAGHPAQGHLAGGGERAHAQLPIGSLRQVHQCRVLGQGEPLITDHVGVDGTRQRVHGSAESPDEGFFLQVKGVQPRGQRTLARCDGRHPASIVA